MSVAPSRTESMSMWTSVRSSSCSSVTANSCSAPTRNAPKSPQLCEEGRSIAGIEPRFPAETRTRVITPTRSAFPSATIGCCLACSWSTTHSRAFRASCSARSGETVTPISFASSKTIV